MLIQGGAGGVGSLAIQIAHKAGAHVITTAQPRQQDTLLRLGADRVIDYAQDALKLWTPSWVQGTSRTPKLRCAQALAGAHRKQSMR